MYHVLFTMYSDCDFLGYNADEGTLTVIECRTGLVIWRYHIVRNHGRGDAAANGHIVVRDYDNYEGTSRGMEGYSVDKVLLDIKDSADKFRVGMYVHDNDASTAQKIRKYFPFAQEGLDVGHASKNIRKQVVDLGKKYPALRGLGERVKRTFAMLCRYAAKA